MRSVQGVICDWFVSVGNRSNLETFLAHLDTNDWNIKLSFNVSTEKIEFLDLQLSVDQKGNIHSIIFRKKTSTNSVLHARSAHPKHTIRAIPKGQFIRARRICDTDEEFEVQAKDITSRFLNREYNHSDIDRGYQQVKNMDHNTLLQGRQLRKEDSRLRIITNNHGRWRDMMDVFNRFWPILKQDSGLSLTSRQLRVRILEHAKHIKSARLIGLDESRKEDVAKLKTLPAHYREFHSSGTIDLQVRVLQFPFMTS
ncbi:uncharacterized protein [Dendrobates tinctorius]|uniref:uncharacterized protein isoform X2 n=1 Tax=Dendrobates tinctorius TaxID=92724 RepID=UPI003CCA04E9